MSKEYLKPVIVAALLGVLTIVCMYVTFITDAPTEKRIVRLCNLE